MAKITIIGTGYVGLVSGACFADMGNDVICLDIDEDKIKKLENGVMPIYEEGLKDIVERSRSEGRLKFSTDYKLAVEFSDLIFICVGTPMDKDGKADLKYVFDAAKSIAKNINNYKIIVDKSTVPPFTGDAVKKIVKDNLKKAVEFDIVSNPEFLQQGKAITDFRNPDRIVIGVESERAKAIMEDLYKPIQRIDIPIMITDIITAEMIKYAANGMLATRISFMNDIANLSEKIGADITQIAEGIGMDKRIGPKFLHAGTGYGGSCFPKDIKAMIHIGKEYGYHMKVMEAVDKVNEFQKTSLFPKIENLVDIENSTIAVLGLSFKPKTDDIREAPAIELIKKLLEKGSKVQVYDPVATDNAKKTLTTTDNITYFNTPFEAVHNADVAVIMTEWDQFRQIDLEAVKKLMKTPNIIDGRNIYEPEKMKKLGFNYISVGRNCRMQKQNSSQ